MSSKDIVNEQMIKRERHWLSKKRYWFVLIAVMFTLVFYFVCLHTTSFVISKRTTFLTEPLTSDGKYVDYFRVLESEEPKIAPEENGVRLILQKIKIYGVTLEYLGDDKETPNYRRRLYEKLNIAPENRPTLELVSAKKYFESVYSDNQRWYAAEQFRKMLEQCSSDEERNEKIEEKRDRSNLAYYTEVKPPTQDWSEFFLKERYLKFCDTDENNEYASGLSDEEREELRRLNALRPSDEKVKTQLRTAPWTLEEFPFMEEWLKNSEESIAVVTEAVRKPHLFYPLIRLDEKESLCLTFFKWSIFRGYILWDFEEAVRSRMYFHLGSGHTQEALYDFETLCEFYKKGFYARQSVFDTFQMLLQHGNLTKEQLKSLAKNNVFGVFQGHDREYLEYGLMGKGLQSDLARMRRQRFCALDFMQRFVKGDPELPSINEYSYVSDATGPRSIVDWNQVGMRINDMFDKMEECRKSDQMTQSSQKLDAFCDEYDEMSHTIDYPRSLEIDISFFTKHSADKYFHLQPRFTVSSRSRAAAFFISEYMVNPPAWRDNTATIVTAKTRRGLAQIGIALKLYQLDHDGKYPETLEMLVPEYLQEIPQRPASTDSQNLAESQHYYYAWEPGKGCAASTDELDEPFDFEALVTQKPVPYNRTDLLLEQ